MYLTCHGIAPIKKLLVDFLLLNILGIPLVSLSGAFYLGLPASVEYSGQQLLAQTLEKCSSIALILIHFDSPFQFSEIAMVVPRGIGCKLYVNKR